MWLAFLAMVVTFAVGSWLQVTVRVSQAAYLSVLTVVLLETAVKAVRQKLDESYSDLGLLQHVAGLVLVALGLTFLGEHFEVGRMGTMSGLTLAVEVALTFRIFAHIEAIWKALGTDPGVPSPYETYGPSPGPGGGAGKAGEGA